MNTAHGATWMARLPLVGFVFRSHENFLPLLIQQGAMCPRIKRGLRPVASRDDVAVVYPVRSAQYQFCNCGVV